MKWYFKLVIIYIMRYFIRILYIIFPIRENRILFSAHEGRSYKCNPKYVFEYLYTHFNVNFEYVWCINDSSVIPSEYNIKCVKFLSIKHLYYLITSQIIISNIQIEPFLPPHKKRLVINTWHGGGAYKKGGLSATYYSKPHRFYFKEIRNMRAKSTNYFISSCSAFSKIFSKEFNVTEHKMLPIGLPRNDIFFKNTIEKELIRNRVRRSLGLDQSKFILLYAPTYRGHERSVRKVNLGIDVLSVCKAVEKRFGKEVIFLFRCHMNMKKNYSSLDLSVDVSDYPDMQELLLLADMIISDYSSFIWDYTFTYKPGFLFTPDLIDYENEVKFHFPIQEWPYPYALNNEELCWQIINYNESEAKSKIKEHHNLLGSYESGEALPKISSLLLEKIGKN